MIDNYGELRSRKTLANNATETDCEALVKTLFPHSSIESLRGLSRAALLERASIEADYSPKISHQISSATSPGMKTPNDPRSVPNLEAIERLHKLQFQDSTIFEWDEISPESHYVVEDDVNALSLSQERKSSFVSISSVAAAVRALKNILPAHLMDEKPIIPKKSSVNELPNQTPIISQSTPNRVSSYREEQRLIDAYFAAMHVFAPIIHEPSFRTKYLTSQGSHDRSWLALLNMVLALGSITSSAGDSTKDLSYYSLAKQYLSLDGFGSGKLETLQALVLMGGLYLHFRNQPNMASAIIGACHRIASSIGLHMRESEDYHGKKVLQEEIKRRNWWTIYVLDTWDSMTLGRPSAALGILVDTPKNIVDEQVRCSHDFIVSKAAYQTSNAFDSLAKFHRQSQQSTPL